MFDKDIFFIAKRWEAIVCSQVVASLIVYNFNEKNHTSRLGTIEIDERNFFLYPHWHVICFILDKLTRIKTNFLRRFLMEYVEIFSVFKNTGTSRIPFNVIRGTFMSLAIHYLHRFFIFRRTLKPDKLKGHHKNNTGLFSYYLKSFEP